MAVTCACASTLLHPRVCDAQAVQPREALEDARLYFTAPLRWDGRDWLEFGGTLVAIGVIHEFDDDVRDHFADASAPLDGDDPNNLDDALPAAVMLAGTWLLNNLLKTIFQRTRPDTLHLVAVGGFSFPSGHAMIATAFYGMLGYIMWSHLLHGSKPAWYVLLLTFCLVIAIGVSRVYLGVHYPSDVVAGFAAGGVCLLACVLTLRALRRSRS